MNSPSKSVATSPKRNRKMKSLDQIVAMRKRGMTMEAIGAVCGCTKQNIQYLLERAEIKKETVAKFREEKATVWEDTERRLLKALDDTKIAKMSGKELVIAAAVALDKGRLITGQTASGGNVSLLVIANRCHQAYQSGKLKGEVIEAEIVTPTPETVVEEVEHVEA